MSRVFISYAREDFALARRLYQDLKELGASPWLDKEDLLGGQDWQDAIAREIRGCSHFVALLSENSVSKRGYVQKELLQALEILDQVPPGEVFVVPVRLDASEPTHEKLIRLHWIDLFPDYREGFQKIAKSLGLHTGPLEAESSVPPRLFRRRPSGVPEEVMQVIWRKAEADFPNDISTRRYVIKNEVEAWRRIQSFSMPGVPDEVLREILSRAAEDFSEDFSTQLYQVNREIEAWTELQGFTAADIEGDVVDRIVAKARADFPRDYSTQLYQVRNEIEAWHDLYG